MEYDVIGLNVEGTLVHFNNLVLTKFLVKIYLEALHKDHNYPKEICESISNLDLSFCFNNAVWDIKNGTILKLGYN